MNRFRLLLAALIALAALPAAAQDVQRCEAADGKVSYANGPCPPGSTAMRTLPPAGAPSAADQKAAQQRLQQDARGVAALDRARKAEEDRVAREHELALSKAKKQESQCRRLQASLRYAQEDLASARLHKRAEAQRRVVRAEDRYVEDCGPVRK
jgi:hypothetical protein